MIKTTVPDFEAGKMIDLNELSDYEAVVAMIQAYAKASGGEYLTVEKSRKIVAQFRHLNLHIMESK